MKDERSERLATLEITDTRWINDGGLYLGHLEDGTSIFLKDRAGNNEVGAYHLSRDLGFDLVPPTVGRDVEIDGVRRHVTVNEDIFADPLAVDVPPLEHFSDGDLLNAAIFDTLVLATERENKNWAGVQGSPHWRLILYDNGEFFGNRGFRGSDIRRRMVGTPIPPEIVDRLRAYGHENRINLPRPLGESKAGTIGVLERLDALVRDPVITPEPWERDGGKERERQRLRQAAQQERAGAKR